MTNQRGFILPNPYLLMAAGIAIVVSFGLGYWRGWQSGMENYYDFKSHVEMEQEQLRLEHQQEKVAMAAVQRRTEQGWQSAIVELDRLGRIRVQPTCGPREMRPTAPTVAKPDATASKPASSAEPSAPTTVSISEAEAIIDGGVKDATRILWLHDYIEGIKESYK